LRATSDFIWTGGDCHVCDNHPVQVRTEGCARSLAPVAV